MPRTSPLTYLLAIALAAVILALAFVTDVGAESSAGEARSNPARTGAFALGARTTCDPAHPILACLKAARPDLFPVAIERPQWPPRTWWPL